MVARHEWLRPEVDPIGLDNMFSDAELDLGGTNYHILHVVGIVWEVENVSQVFSNLPQEKERLNAPTPMTIVGTDAGDLSTMRVTGIDENLALVERDFTLTGLTGVDIGSWLRVLMLEWAGGPPLVSGAFIYKTGVTLPTLADPTTFLHAGAELQIHPGISAHRSYDGGFAVPQGYESYISGFQFIPEKNVAYHVSAQARPMGDPTAPWQTIYHAHVGGTVALHYAFKWRRIPEMWEGRVLVSHDSGGTKSTCELNYQVLMVRKAAS